QSSMSASSRNEACALRRGMGSLVVTQSIRTGSIASSGLLPSGTGILTARFQFERTLPAFSIALSSLVVWRTMRFFFVAMGSPEQNSADPGPPPYPHKRVYNDPRLPGAARPHAAAISAAAQHVRHPCPCVRAG